MCLTPPQHSSPSPTPPTTHLLPCVSPLPLQMALTHLPGRTGCGRCRWSSRAPFALPCPAVASWCQVGGGWGDVGQGVPRIAPEGGEGGGLMVRVAPIGPHLVEQPATERVGAASVF